MPETVNGSATSMGFFGKLPSHGDFVSRHLPRSFTDPWDNWLQSVIANSREQLTEGWLDIYLTSPIWRFALSSGLCGDTPWTGVVMPSVDRVGRYFPLTLAVPLDGKSNLMRLLTDTDDWFLTAEDLALSSLEDNFDIDDFDQSIQALRPPPLCAGPEELGRFRTSRPAWQFSLSAVNGSEQNLACIGQTLLNNQFQAYSLWWTQGSERISPSLLITEGLPPVSGFSGFLDGDWNKWGWGQYRLPQDGKTDSETEGDEHHPLT
ncbi:MAG: type VI secretion system-associated protein TagF [Pseudomonadota bacterium]